MKRIILYIAASIDGRIAEPDGGVRFLEAYPVNEEMNYGYDEFIASVDTVIMGGNTYRGILQMGGDWPYPELQTFVISRQEYDAKEQVRFIRGNVVEAVAALRNSSGKDIWLEGGGEVVALLLQAGLVDEMRIFYVPVVLGKGIRLFPEQEAFSTWTLTRSELYPNGVLGVTYQKSITGK